MVPLRGSFDSESVMDGSELFEPESMYAIMARSFPIWHIFECCSLVLHTFFPCCLSIWLFCYVPFVTIFCSKIVLLPCIWLLVCLGAIFLVVLEYPVLSLMFYPMWISFLYCFLRQNFWFISSGCNVRFTCVAFSFLSQKVPVFFLCFIIFACYRRFLISVSSRILQPRFEFLSVFFFFFFGGGSPIFSQTIIIMKN